MSQKFTIVHFFEVQAPGLNFSAKAWPLHTTLLDIFTLGGSLEDVQNGLQEIANTTAPFDITAVRETRFGDNQGDNQEVAVTLLSLDPAILELHKQLVALAEATSIIPDHPEYVGAGYVPHATIHGNTRLELGKTYRISNISLVDMYPDDNITRRAIIKTYALI